jgi:hypothetical protein
VNDLTQTCKRAAINLVCTRCTDGQHDALQRWYNDHAQLLMASPQLQQARLYEWLGPAGQSASAPDYFCVYEFERLSDFAAFDSGEVMTKVRDLSNAAAGRSSIDIIKRTQYERLLHRRWPSEGAANLCQASLLVAQERNEAQIQRWINDVIYGLHLSSPLASAQVYLSATQQGAELFVLLEAPSALPLDWHSADSAYAQRPVLQSVWQGQAKPVAQWRR